MAPHAAVFEVHFRLCFFFSQGKKEKREKERDKRKREGICLYMFSRKVIAKRN